RPAPLPVPPLDTPRSDSALLVHPATSTATAIAGIRKKAAEHSLRTNKKTRAANEHLGPQQRTLSRGQLFEPKRLNRIQRGRFACRVEAEENANERRK